MKYFIIEPEVAGHKGDNTVQDRSVHPPRVSRLHYEFDDWLGDDILEVLACFIVTKRLADGLKSLLCTGIEFDELEVSKSELFEEFHSDMELPEFVWLKIIGLCGMDDFGMSENHRLVVSERILNHLKLHRIHNCDVEEWTSKN